jgi:hypothetical protein
MYVLMQRKSGEKDELQRTVVCRSENGNSFVIFVVINACSLSYKCRVCSSTSCREIVGFWHTFRHQSRSLCLMLLSSTENFLPAEPQGKSHMYALNISADVNHLFVKNTRGLHFIRHSWTQLFHYFVQNKCDLTAKNRRTQQSNIVICDKKLFRRL